MSKILQKVNERPIRRDESSLLELTNTLHRLVLPYKEDETGPYVSSDSVLHSSTSVHVTLSP